MEENNQLTHRDKLLRDTFTPAEGLLYWTILITVLATSWIADPRSYWVLGFMLIVGGCCPIILKTHQYSHPFFIDHLWTRFWALSAPAWLITLQFTVGVLQDPIHETKIGRELFLIIQDVNHALPVSAATKTTWITLLGFSSIYLVAMNLFIVPKSRSFFERLLPYLCLNAVLVAILGYCQLMLGLERPWFTNGTGQSDFFAFFPYDGHWAAFALLWSSVCIAMALLSSRYDDTKSFVESTAPWYLTGATLLAGTGFLVQARWPAAILLLTFSVMLLILTLNYLANVKDPNRMAIVVCSGVVATITFTGGMFRALQTDAYADTANHLRHAALEMFRDSPLFGWGLDSFSQLLPFYANDTLLSSRHDRATSNILQTLAEFGILGCAPLLIVIIYLLFRYFKGQHDIHLTNHMLIGCAGLLIFSVIDSPFMSPAVSLSFFIIFFSALRWGDLSRNRVDEVDTKPNVVINKEKRTVPFHRQDYEEKFK